MVLGQTRTEAHSNEITAIPELLKVLELKGCLVTIDAMGCQRNIAQQVVQGGADYLLAVKANQGELHENIKDLFACCERVGWDGVAYSHHEQVGKDHGRLDAASAGRSLPRGTGLRGPQRQWASLGAVARVSYRRDAATDAPTDTRYYICSYPADAATLLASARSHWEHREQPALGVGRGLQRGPQPGEDRPRRPEPSGDQALGLEPAQAGTYHQSRHQSQT